MTISSEETFWTLAETFLREKDVTEGKLMSHRCLRIQGDFLATVHRANGNLVVKLNADRVSQLIADGDGIAFAPAGRTFREWVSIPSRDTAEWRTLIQEAIDLRRAQA